MLVLLLNYSLNFLNFKKAVLAIYLTDLAGRTRIHILVFILAGNHNYSYIPVQNKKRSRSLAF